MGKYTREELSQALQVVSSTIVNCEKMRHKFEESTPQYIRFNKLINAMYISKGLITKEISERG